jgi:secreted effector protein PipB2
MDKNDFAKLFAAGAAGFNAWRAQNPNEPLDLTGYDFQFPLNSIPHFGGINLSGAKLDGISVWGADRDWPDEGAPVFANANLKNASLRNAYFIKNSFINADLSGADLTGIKLEQVVLKGANLQNAILDGATLIHCDLTGANMTGTSLIGTTLTDCDQ